MSLNLKPMIPRNGDEHERASTQLELFFDLVSVIAIASITASFHHAISAGHGLEALPNFLLLFFAAWLAWMNYTWFANSFDNDDPLYRILTILIMAGALIFAGGATHIFETSDFMLGIIGWMIMRFGMILMWIRVAIASKHMRKTALKFCTGLIGVQFIWVAVNVFRPESEPGYYLLVSLVCVIELLIPAVASRGLTALPIHRGHIIERHGLLNIIVLGEVLLSIALAVGKIYQGEYSPDLGVMAISGMVIVFALWWIYFIEDEHLVSTRRGNAFVWSYVHVFIFGAAAAVGSGLGALVDIYTHHSKIDEPTAMMYLSVPIAVYLIGLWAARDRFHLLGRRGVALPVPAALIVGAAYFGAPIWVIALLLVGALIWRAGPVKT
jgi:low temperature requirement protein LtrA